MCAYVNEEVFMWMWLSVCLLAKNRYLIWLIVACDTCQLALWIVTLNSAPCLKLSQYEFRHNSILLTCVNLDLPLSYTLQCFNMAISTDIHIIPECNQNKLFTLPYYIYFSDRSDNIKLLSILWSSQHDTLCKIFYHMFM